LTGRAAFQESCRWLDAGQDPHLEHYFTPTRSIEHVAAFGAPETLAVGIKGVGKSSAFRYFTEFDQNADIVVGVTPESHTVHLPNRKLHYSTCMKQFEYDLVIEALKAVVDRRSQLSLNAKVPAPILDQAAKHVSTFKKSLVKWAGRLGGISVLGCGFTVNAPPTETPALVGIEGDAKIVEPRRTLEALCRAGIRIRLVVDDPEQVFSASQDLDAHLVGGFCLAALRLSSTIENLKIIVLLKSHVYYQLLGQIDDLGKHIDHAGRLSWTREELLEVIDHRLRWADVLWTNVFEASEADAHELIADMSSEVRNGPRDLLRWLYYALERAAGGRVSRQHVEETRSQMAIEALRELEVAFLNDYKGVTPVLRSIFGKDLSNSFTLDGLRAHIADQLVTSREMRVLARLRWMQSQTSHTLPAVFLRVGALAFQSGDSLVLPYNAGYDEGALERATGIRLVPAIAAAIG